MLCALAVATLMVSSAAAEPPVGDAGTSLSETQVNELMTMPLEDLLNMPVEIASQKAQTVRETPGVVTIITREEIINSGARDLTDVLLLVPGFSFPGSSAGSVGPYDW